jgi:hypothetical protein
MNLFLAVRSKLALFFLEKLLVQNITRIVGKGILKMLNLFHHI